MTKDFPDLPELGDLEHEVMQIVWALGPITAEDVRTQVKSRLKESTVRTVLRRLEDKGFLTHTVVGRTYLFAAAEDRPKVAARAVKRVVDWFCQGSVDEVLVGMVDADMLSEKQLAMLSAKIEAAKKGKR